MLKVLTQEQVIELAVSEGVKTALKYLEYERTKKEARKSDGMKRNTRLLLYHFRELETAAQCNSESTVEEVCEFCAEALAKMSVGSLSEARDILKAIEDSPLQAAMLTKYMKSVLDIYKAWCERTGKAEKLRCYRVLYALYFSPEIRSTREIAASEYVDKRTVYRDVRTAIEVLLFLIFGTYNFFTASWH